MGTTRFHNVRLVAPGEEMFHGWIEIRDGRIAAFGSGDSPAVDSAYCIDGKGRLLSPGLIDMHAHGIHTYNFEASPEELLAGLKCLPRYGTTSVCPTLYRVLTPDCLREVEALAAALQSPLPVFVPGLHLEGPFLKLAGAGAATTPADIGLLRELLAAGRGKIAAMSISPETINVIPIIECLMSHGVVPFITHTCASYEETTRAIDAGARHATHFYDVFPAPEATDGGVRPVGAMEALMVHPLSTVDFIADGVHVHPGAIKLAVRCKGASGVALITDSNIGAGLGSGCFQTSWGFAVNVASGGGVRVADPDHPKFGRLAGSALTMDAGLHNLIGWLDLPLPDVIAMATAVPARILGRWARGCGELKVGGRGDLVLWGRDGDRLTADATWVSGDLVWDRTSVSETQLEAPAR